MKKETILLLTLTALMLGIGGGFYFYNQSSEANFGNSSINLSKWQTGSGATSTPTYLSTGTASTTFAFDTSSADQIDLNLLAMGSSSASNLLWSVDFSNQNNCSASNANVDWFNEDGYTNTSNTLVTHGAGTRIHSLNLATSSNDISSEYVYKNITIVPVASRCTRINFNTSEGNTALWAEAVLREQIQ